MSGAVKDLDDRIPHPSGVAMGTCLKPFVIVFTSAVLVGTTYSLTFACGAKDDGVDELIRNV